MARQLDCFPQLATVRGPRRMWRDGHTIAYREIGNPCGRPVVVLHGGPGSGSRPGNAPWFDLTRWRIIFVDQRGAGISTPRGSTRHNNTAKLIGDLEALRRQLGIERWCVVGGSWGAALALAYAGQHPEHVLGVVLRGLFLTSPREVRALFVTSRTRAPREWRLLMAAAGARRADRLLSRCAQCLQPGANAKQRRAVALAWYRYETAVLTGRSPRNERVSRPTLDLMRDKYRIQVHYLQRNCWLGQRHLLAWARRAGQAGVPIHAVHGWHDPVCPVNNVARLERAVPSAVLDRVDAGHLAATGPLAHGLARAVHALSTDTSGT
ncbi:prolyl aminopeptidase [Burkholderia lata]|nr:prolyl aminopeptidase [Burkholderia lata]